MSSDSKTGSSRSSKGSKRSKKRTERTERHDDLRPVVVDTGPERTNLLAMVLGMVTTIVLVFGVFGLGSERVVNERYNKEQAQRQEERDQAKRADTLDELAIKLAELGSQRTSGLPEALQVCRSRIEISNQIISRSPSDEAIRQKAVREGILARVKLFGLNFTKNLGLDDAGSDLEAAYTPYLEDSNPEIYSSARIALLTHRSFEKIRSGDDDVSDMVDLFSDTMERFPKDDYVASMIEAHLFVLVEKETSYADALYSKLRKRSPEGSLSPVMERKMRNIADRLLLKSENFDRKFTDRWANGKAGRRELTQTVTRLLNKNNAGLLLVQRALAVGQWFERNDFSDDADAVYKEMIASTTRGTLIPEFRDDAKRYAEQGLARLALPGKTIQFRGEDSAGKLLKDAESKKKVGVVVFWSAKSESSIRYLSELNASSRALNGKPICIYAVCVDPELPREINVTMRTSPMIRIIKSKFQSGKNSLLEQCPPGTLPHVMLVDFAGVVHDVNAADPGQVKNEMLKLLINRNR